MLEIGSRLFVHVADGTKQRILHPAKVIEAKPDVYTVEFQDEQLAVIEGQDILIFRRLPHKFLQQAAIISKIIEIEPRLVIELETIGEPASAESRQEYRVTTYGTDMTVELGEETDCQILDVGRSGFSAAASKKYEIESILHATLRYEDEEYEGQMRIQSIREMNNGQTRYGLLCVDSAGVANSLAKGLPKVFMSVQRAQLRRTVGTA